MKIAVLGADGYIGRNLIERLLEQTDHSVVALSRGAESIKRSHKRLTKHNVNVFDTEKLHRHLNDCDAVYYLIHMMAQKEIDFAKAEAMAAQSLRKAAHGTQLKKVIYLGGLGNDNEKLSKHLASRHHTGKILRDGTYSVIEFRASMIIGQGSISFDIIANLIHKLPILTLPRWAKTMTQPIGLEDAISYLAAALDLDVDEDQIIEIGGPEKLSYEDLMRRYADWKQTHALIINFPIIPAGIAAWWLNLFTPKTHAKVGIIMVNSLSNAMVVTDNKADELFPDIQPKPLEDVFV